MPTNLLGPSFKFHFEGNADEACVLEGHTFYSNSETLRTGTLTDRNTVGKNGCIGMNDNYPNVAFTFGSTPQITTLVNGARNECLAIMVPWGWYNGNTYVGMFQTDIANAIGVRPDIIRAGNRVLGITGTFNGDNNNIIIELAGRVWANGYVLGSGYAGSNYAYGSNDQYSARLYAGPAGNYGVWCKDAWSFRWYNAGEQLMYVGPDNGYGNGQAYYAHH